MSECHFWWRAGETQWCDMIGEECHCSGWEESCDLKKVAKQKLSARLVAQVEIENTENEDEEEPPNELKRSA